MECNVGVRVDHDVIRLVDEIDSDSPPADPLQFPVPTFLPCSRRKILAWDPRTGEKHAVKALVKRQPKNAFPVTETAYFLKTELSRSGEGQETTWAAVVLQLERGDPHKKEPAKSRWTSTGNLVAIRVSSWKKLSVQNKQCLLQEVSALQFVGESNPHIQGCLDLLKDEKRVYTVLPYNPEDRLSSGLRQTPIDPTHIRRSSEHKGRSIFRQLCTGLLHLQHKGIYHGNICLQSLLLVENHKLVISDLERCNRVPFNDPFNIGYTTNAAEGESRRLIQNVFNRGGAKYQAPEVGRNAFDAFQADVWSAGVVLFVLLTGIAPFKRAKTSDPVFKLVSSGKLWVLLESWDIKLSEEACDLLQSMLWRKPQDRISLNEILDHPWFTSETKPMKSKWGTSGICSLPPQYFRQDIELLKQEIRQQRGNAKARRTNKMRLSLRQELMLRTQQNLRQVHFGPVATLVFGPQDSAMVVAQQKGRLPMNTGSPILGGCAENSEKAPVPHQAVTRTELPAQRRAGTLKRLIKSAKKTLQAMVGDKSRGEAGGPFVVSARSA